LVLTNKENCGVSALLQACVAAAALCLAATLAKL
jgi:hypothetical protein